MASIGVPADVFTVQEVAERFGKSDAQIRRLCIDYDLGTLVYGRIRLLKKKDIQKLEKHFSERGRNRPKKNPEDDPENS